MSVTHCGACYGERVWCRRCKTTHCLCNWSQCQRKPRVVMHLSVTRPGAWGGTLTTALCGRLRTLNDGMNLAETEKDVTCKFCLKMLAKREKSK
jgi:hypothetical protein